MCEDSVRCQCYKNGMNKGLLHADIEMQQRVEKAEKLFKDRVEDEQKLSDAYVRLRIILDALNAPSELIRTGDVSLLWNWVERRAERVVQERNDALGRVKELEAILHLGPVDLQRKAGLDKPGRSVSLKEARDIALNTMKEAEERRTEAAEKEAGLEEETVKPKCGPFVDCWWCTERWEKIT